jgi:hypothetical protein
MAALRLFLRALALGLALLSAVYLGVAGWSARRTLQVMRTWPGVTAEVVASRVVAMRGHGAVPALLDWRIYGAECRMRYMIGDTIYTSRVEIGYRSSRRAAMQGWVERFPVGSHPRVRYDPAAPERLSLADRVDAVAFAPALSVLSWAVATALGGGACWLASRVGAGR